MKNLDSKNYVEKKDKRETVHSIENYLLQDCNDSKPLKTQYQVMNETKMGQIQRVIEIEIEVLELNS